MKFFLLQRSQTNRLRGRGPICRGYDNLLMLNQASHQVMESLDRKDIFKTLFNSTKSYYGFSKSVVFLLKDKKLQDQPFWQSHDDSENSEIMSVLALIKKAPNLETMKYFSENGVLLIPIIQDQNKCIFVVYDGKLGFNLTSEIEAIISTILTSVVSHLNNIEYVEIIKDHNNSLEKKVIARTKQLVSKTKEIESMLQNLRLGIFTLVYGSNQVHGEYSAYLSEILEEDDIESIDIIDSLFRSANINNYEIDQLRTCLDASFDGESFIFEANSHLLPNKIVKDFDGYRKKYLEIEWEPISSSVDAQVYKIMVIGMLCI